MVLQRNLVSWLLLSHPGHGSLMLNLAFVSTPEASRLTKPTLSPDWIRWTSTTSPFPVGRGRMSNTTARELSLLVFTIAASVQTEHFAQICTNTYQSSSVRYLFPQLLSVSRLFCHGFPALMSGFFVLHCHNNFPRAMINLEWVPGPAA